MVNSTSISITPSKHADRHRTGGDDALTGAVGIDGISVNRVAGITPTVTPAWLVPSATLENITDGDVNTYTTGGTDNIVGTDNEIVNIDLGALFTIREIYYCVSVYSQYNTGVSYYIEVSPDNAAWSELATGNSPLNAVWDSFAGEVYPTEQIRYIRVRMAQWGESNDYRYRIHAIDAY